MYKECEYMTAFGCPARDYAKSLMLQEMLEGDDQQMCKKMCCQECEEVCGYRCGKCHKVKGEKHE